VGQASCLSFVDVQSHGPGDSPSADRLSLTGTASQALIEFPDPISYSGAETIPLSRAASAMDREYPANSEPAPSFDVDGNLGRLAKWLRVLGFDAAYPCTQPSRERIFVTMRTSTAQVLTVVLTSADPLEQLREIFDETGVRPDPGLFLSRCVICNVPVEAISAAAAGERIPAAVHKSMTPFHACPRCGRIYWEGSHVDRMKRRLVAAHVVPA
jgi:uncharacterized protein